MQQRPPPSEFLEQLRAFIADESNPPTERRQMVGILSDASIEETAVLLVRFATTQQDRVLRDMATTGIAGLGNYGPRDFVFPMLEPVWRAASEPKLLDAVAMAIANGGAPAGTELLLESALLESGRDDVRRRAAVIALTKVQTRNAVPPLAKLLIATEPGTPANTLSFNTLRQIGDPTAAQALISWLQSTDERSAPMAREWTAHLRTEIEYKAAQAALDPAVPFRNEANRNALRQGLADFDRSRRTLP